MVSEFAPGVRKRRMITRIGLAVGAVTVIGTAVAFNTLFARPGEDALQLVPGNALMVGSLDLSPSPTQTLVFKQIDDALSRNGLDKKIDSALTDLVTQGSTADKIRAYAKRGAAFAMLPTEKTGEAFNPGDSAVAFFPVSDGPAVAKILSTEGKPSFFKGTRYRQVHGDGPGLMVVNDFLVVGMGPALHQVELVVENKQDSILENPEFVAERAKIDADSNLMVFIAPKAWQAFSADAPKEAKEFMDNQKWMAMGVAIRDGGIALSFNGEYDATKAKWLQPFSSMKPLRDDLLSVLPEGAYGFTALSQPSKYFESFELAATMEPDGKKMISEMERELGKETNLSLRQDVLPAFQGNAVIGFYPNTGASSAEGADILLLIDDQNGAKAALLAERVRERLEQEIAEGNEESPFEMTEVNGIKRYTLAGEASAEFQDGLSESLSSDGAVKAGVMSKDKTITWALVGQTVVASSNAKLMDKAIASLQSKQSSLESDPLWKGKTNLLVKDQQVLLAFNVARIVEGVENSIDMKKVNKDDQTPQEVVNILKGLKEPFYVKTSTSNGRSSLGLFIPMEYDKLIDLIGKNMNKTPDTLVR